MSHYGLVLSLLAVMAMSGKASARSQKGAPEYDSLRKECAWFVSLDDLDSTTLQRWEDFKRRVPPGFVIETLTGENDANIQALLLGLGTDMGIDGLLPRAFELLDAKDQHVVQAALLYVSLKGTAADVDAITSVAGRPWGHTGIADNVADALSTILPPAQAIEAMRDVGAKSPDAGVVEVVDLKISRLRALGGPTPSEEAVIELLVFGSSDDARWAAMYVRRRPRAFYPRLRAYAEEVEGGVEIQQGSRALSGARKELLKATLESMQTVRPQS